MKEDFLQYIWRFSLLGEVQLQTTNSDSLVVEKPGLLNTNAGPDFLQARLQINGQTWIGDVEIHLKSSDWYAHHHEEDAAYDAVILHVVWTDDVSVFMKNNQQLPTLVLQHYVPPRLLENFKRLFNSPSSWILCEDSIKHTPTFVFQHWKERLFFERLEQKANEMTELLKNAAYDWEYVFFQLLAARFGGLVNKQAFLDLANSIPFHIIRKERFNDGYLEALFFGQAGFLADEGLGVYRDGLRQTYQFLKAKYRLQSLPSSRFQFFRMRPSSFPTVRIAQLARLYSGEEHLFSKSIKALSIEAIYTLFKVKLSSFWDNHYTFEKKSGRAPKRLTTSFIDILIINTILPLRLLYQQEYGKGSPEHLIDMMMQLSPEKNRVIESFRQLGVVATHALDTQALLMLKQNYCTPKQCLQCAIGNHFLVHD